MKQLDSNKDLLKKEKKKNLRQPNLTPEAIRERRTKPPQSYQKERNMKIRSEKNEKEMKEMIAKIIKIKSLVFEKINKIDKPLARLMKKTKREKTQINRIINEKGEVTIDTAEIQS